MSKAKTLGLSTGCCRAIRWNYLHMATDPWDKTLKYATAVSFHNIFNEYSHCHSTNRHKSQAEGRTPCTSLSLLRTSKNVKSRFKNVHFSNQVTCAQCSSPSLVFSSHYISLWQNYVVFSYVSNLRTLSQWKICHPIISSRLSSFSVCPRWDSNWDYYSTKSSALHSPRSPLIAMETSNYMYSMLINLV
jgi:hypothetical protein